MWLLLFVFVITLIYFYIWLKHADENNKLKHVTQPKPVPLLGNALDVYKTDIVLNSLCRYEKEFKGSLIRLKIGVFRNILVAFDYNFLEAVFTSNKNIGKSIDYKQLRAWLGLGLLTSTGERWQKRRKLLTPAFHFQILDNFVDIFHKQSNILVEKLQKEVNQPSVDIYDYVTLCALDVISESAMGTKINAQSNNDSIYVKSVKEMGRIVMERNTHPLKLYDFFYKLSRDYQKEKKALKVLHDMTNSIIKQRKEVFKDKETYEEVNEDGTKKRFAFLDLLLMTKTSDGQPLSDSDIREEVDTFMFEGHDTTSSCISFALFMLSKHQNVQNKVYEELYSIFGDDKNAAASLKDLQNMKYLELVILETLRLYPSVPIFGREFSEDLYFDGHVYPKGLNVLVPTYCIHRSERFYPKPHEFQPERFSLENKSERKPFCYFPFSAGPRNCIGQKFAMLEVKSVLSKIIRHYKLLEAPNFEPHLSSEAILKSLNGVHVVLKNRN